MPHPKEPAGLIWTGQEIFGDCKYVYVRLEDHSFSSQRGGVITDYLNELRERNKYGLIAQPWLAEQLYLYGNCLLYGVMTSGANMSERHSKYYKPKRPQFA